MGETSYSSLESLRKLLPILHEIDVLNKKIAISNKNILMIPSKKDDYHSDHAVRMMIIFFVIIFLLLLGIFIFLLQIQSFSHWFNLVIFKHPQLYYILIIAVFLLIAYFISRGIGVLILNHPFDNSKKVEKLTAEKEQLEKKRDELYQKNQELISIVPNEFCRIEVIEYLENALARNPKLSLEDALEDYKKNEMI